MNAGRRLDALISEGGIQVCGNAQNCVRVCPEGDPPDHLHRPHGPRRHAAHAEKNLRPLNGGGREQRAEGTGW